MGIRERGLVTAKLKYPSQLKPTTKEDIKLPSRWIVHIPKTCPVFKKWKGKKVPRKETYGNKSVLSYKGKAFAEIVILRMFQDVGWNGVWVDTYRQKYRTNHWPKDEIDLPPKQQRLLNRISKKLGKEWSGCWDVFCWKGGKVIFAESKKRKEDSIKDNQRRWLAAAINCRLPFNSFLLVEWSKK
jgi:hypothetical protein